MTSNRITTYTVELEPLVLFVSDCTHQGWARPDGWEHERPYRQQLTVAVAR